MVRELIVDSIAQTSGLDKELVTSSFDVYADEEATPPLTVASVWNLPWWASVKSPVRCAALAAAQAKAQRTASPSQ